MTFPNRQHGIVLVVSLLMIAVLALLATASINLSTGSMLIVHNQSSEQIATEFANALVEETLSDLDALKNGVALGPETRNGVAVERTAPVCVAYTPVPGYSLLPGSPVPQYNYYRFAVEATDADSNANARVTVGARVLQNAGTC